MHLISDLLIDGVAKFIDSYSEALIILREYEISFKSTFDMSLAHIKADLALKKLEESRKHYAETISIKVFNIHKGKTLFNAGGHKDFSGIIFIFGTLYMLYMGIINLRRDFNVTLFGKKRVIALSVLSRLILLNLVFALIFWFNLNLAKFSGISFSNFEINIYTKYCA